VKFFFFTHETEGEIKTLEKALQMLDSFPTDEQCHDEQPFIGFKNEKEEIIQFVRERQDKWFLDIPIKSDKSEYGFISMQADINTESVKELVKNFFSAQEFSYIEFIKNKYKGTELVEVAKEEDLKKFLDNITTSNEINEKSGFKKVKYFIFKKDLEGNYPPKFISKDEAIKFFLNLDIHIEYEYWLYYNLYEECLGLIDPDDSIMFIKKFSINYWDLEFQKADVYQ